ncbi:site-specific integrase [Sedimentitalea nanhaiensis]|uniref:site-specific integrase n=1 Tax=Sedimentitalea nanhaiensis TaxID=999627 RepID=UPI000941F541|nr:site-specific integrase [Sedimentitalea nanhaiensis]
MRKACATRLAEAGASEREIMAWTGRTSPQMVQVYAGKAAWPYGGSRFCQAASERNGFET